MAVTSNMEQVTVGIVGGGVGGMVLAKILEKMGISYKLYEARELAPDAGASVGLMPNGLQILDQIGVIDEINKWAVVHNRWEHRDGETGELYLSTKFQRLYKDIFHYRVFFVDRTHLLHIVYASINDKSRLEAFKKVTSIENFDDFATVKAEDGSSFNCQLVVGSDGVHSMVRKFIRNELPAAIPPPDYLTAETYCVFGISKPVATIGAGRYFSIYQADVSVIIFTGQEGRTYWFIFKALEKPMKYGERRKFTEENVQEAYSVVADDVVTDEVRFSDVYNNTVYKITLPVEQGVCESWHAKRMCLIGDASHKSTPHAAMGANMAMESAAALANSIRRLNNESGGGSHSAFSQTKLDAAMDSFEKKRMDRVTTLTKMAGVNQQVLLKTGPVYQQFLEGLPDRKVRDWIKTWLSFICQGDKLEDWPENSAVVDALSARAAEVAKAVEYGAEDQYIDALLAAHADTLED